MPRFCNPAIQTPERCRAVSALYWFGMVQLLFVASLASTVLFSFVVMLILGVLAVVIITNTIKLTVNNRRNEIIIMKYVGATDWFIKWPFVIEGMLIGIVGAVIPLGIAWFSYDGLVDNVRYSEFAMFMQLPFRSASELFPIFAPVTVILGVGIGVLGSISAMRKYLSV